MCGIIGYVGEKKAAPILIEGLKQLEYRGYDSAGLAVLDDWGAIFIARAVGKVSELDKKTSGKNIAGKVGIAHTRWATHGRPSEKNSHPHSDCSGDIQLVHNGIIENYAELKKILLEKKHHFASDTDTEVVAHLIEEFAKKTEFKKAVTSALKLIKGTYGMAIIKRDEPGKIIAAKLGSPLVLGIGKDEFVLASDVSAIARYTDKVIYLEDGEVVTITKDGYEVTNIKNQPVDKKITKLDWTVEKSQKGGYAHFMLKEIFEQPEAIADAIRGRIIKSEGMSKFGGLEEVYTRVKDIEKIVIVSCGTSYHSALVGEYMLEEYAGIPVEVEYASEFRYRKPILNQKTAVIAISQSGETADTLAAIREAKNKGALTLGIVNVVGSSIARETDAGAYTHAGPEIGVASTKAFTTQVAILALITVWFGRKREMSLVMGKRILNELEKIPALVNQILANDKEIKRIARKYSQYNDLLYLGRKYNFPIAIEGALKIKEISYVHAEGYPTGEMKHGPIALIDENFPSIFVAPNDSVYEKNLSGIQEIKARGGRIIAIATQGNQEIKKLANDVIYIPKTLEMLTPILSVIPLQLLAYYVGVFKGLDVDKPRNLAKSVTVE